MDMERKISPCKSLDAIMERAATLVSVTIEKRHPGAVLARVRLYAAGALVEGLVAACREDGERFRVTDEAWSLRGKRIHLKNHAKRFELWESLLYKSLGARPADLIFCGRHGRATVWQQMDGFGCRWLVGWSRADQVDTWHPARNEFDAKRIAERLAGHREVA